ncbi:MAG: helix-turn-helix transcriptional regulator [Tannerellaceae bacterium]|jgi:AraC-like DNA-binding protein|nr:helix-turn-helix transcriptional regulator [Tannerellaceae bacterium]
MNYQFAIKEPLSLRIFSPVQPIGFKYQEVKEGDPFAAGMKDYNRILFVLEGKLKISCNEFINRQVHEKEFVLIPIAADVACKALSPLKIIWFSFEVFVNHFDKNYLRELIAASSKSDYMFVKLAFCEPMDNFIQHLLLYIRQKMDKKILQEIKQMELSVIFRSFYSIENMAALFHPLIGKSYHFRLQVLRNYRKENHVDGLAERIGLEKRSFSRQFKDEFNQSPYQWLLNQKAKHIRFSLAESDKTLEEIRKEHGFKFAGHFTRFCKEQFNCTPVKLRRQLAYEG